MKRFAPGAKLAVGIIAVSVAIVLLYRTLSGYDPDEVIASIRAIDGPHLIRAICWASASYLCLTGFDWLALRYLRQPIPYPYAALTSFTSLSLGHNIGFAALSSGAIRYRFYSRAGLSVGDIAKLIGFCGVTVGLGLLLLAGMALLVRPNLIQRITGLDPSILVMIGVACLAGPGLYFGLACLGPRRLQFRSWSIETPSPLLAAGQLVIGSANFACVAACLHQTLSAVTPVSYLATAAVYAAANGATLATHVPGGLGVIEGVVLLLLGSEMIGAVLAFRFVYFLLPLTLGLVSFASAELVSKAKRSQQAGG